MSIRIEPVDVDHPDQLHQWWQLGSTVNALRPAPLWPAWEVLRARAQTANAEFERLRWIGYVDDRPAGFGQLFLPLRDNPHLGYGDLGVIVADRRGGLGSALLETIEGAMRAAGRRTLLVECGSWADPVSRAGLDFGLARGFAEANVEEIKGLAIADFRSRLSTLQVPESGYRILACHPEVPEEHLSGYAQLLSTFMSQIPTGDLELEDSEWTPARIRDYEERARKSGEVGFVALAIAPDGTVAGVSDVEINTQQTDRAQIGITVVAEEHRGHRLGLALKVASHEALLAAYPEVEVVTTSNASVNEHMNAVNEQMGYRVLETLHELQKSL